MAQPKAQLVPTRGNQAHQNSLGTPDVCRCLRGGLGRVDDHVDDHGVSRLTPCKTVSGIRAVLRTALTQALRWANQELERFKGNLAAHRVCVRGTEYRVLSVYSPAWPSPLERLQGIDIHPIELKLNPDPSIWVTELLWAALLGSERTPEAPPWVVGGDLNSSETFDFTSAGPRGNREILRDLGLCECLRHCNGKLIPTSTTRAVSPLKCASKKRSSPI